MAEFINPRNAAGGHPQRVPPPVHHPGPVTRRQHVIATRTTSTGPAPHPSVYQPWAQLLTQGDIRLKKEITDALRKLEAETAEADQLLDRAYSMAAEAAGALEAAAWAAWGKWMAAADDTRSGIVTPAVARYDEAVAGATARYNAALADARKTYDTIVADADKAKADARLTAA